MYDKKKDSRSALHFHREVSITWCGAPFSEIQEIFIARRPQKPREQLADMEPETSTLERSVTSPTKHLCVAGYVKSCPHGTVSGDSPSPLRSIRTTADMFEVAAPTQYVSHRPAPYISMSICRGRPKFDRNKAKKLRRPRCGKAM